MTTTSPQVSKSTIKTEDNSEVPSVQNGGGSSVMDLQKKRISEVLGDV